jgi:hypothetical protein
MIQYDDLLHRLRTSTPDDFSVGEPASAGAIAEAEFRLEVSFPPSYRRFLEVLGGLQAPPCEVFGLGSSGELSVVAQSVRWRGKSGVPARAVVIGVDELEVAPVGFVPPPNGAEPPILRWEQDRTLPIATDFRDHLASLAADVLPAEKGTSAVRVFDPPWGQRRLSGAVQVDRKEVKLAYTLVQRIQYDGVSFAQLVQELNSRRMPARGLREWTIEAAREAYETWKDRY